jgi:uncharacterized membrane protein
MSEQDELRALRALVEQLSARVDSLERVSQHVAPPPPAIPPRPQNQPAWQAEHTTRAAVPLAPPTPGGDADQSLERRIGSQWLNRVGVVAVLIGVSYFLKLAFDSGWIGPGVRVLLGLLAGTGLCWWSERFRRPNSLAFSYSLKAIGVGAMYLSLWASFQLYQLIPGAIAFLAMTLVTAVTAALAIFQDAELLAGLALLGGLLTPVLCSTSENHQAVLFCYLLLLSGGALALQRVKSWPRILLGAFFGSVVLATSWFQGYYSVDQFAESLLLTTLLFALFAVAPLYATLEQNRPQSSGLVLGILNATGYFAAVYHMLLQDRSQPVQPRAAACALALAAVYAALAIALERRVSGQPPVERLLPIVHYGLAVTFLTVGIALKLHQHWITLAWLMEGGLLFWAGSATRRSRLKFFSGCVVALGIVRLLALDLEQWGTQHSIFNPRLFTMAVAAAVLLWMVYQDRNTSDHDERTAIALAVICANALVLLAIGLEIHDTFAVMLRGMVVDRRNPASYDIVQARHGLTILRGFCYSALFMLYGAAMMWLGFLRNSVLLRWMAIVLIAFTVVKVFVFDAWSLEHGWRVLSFITLGVILLAVSYAYQRDWLRLQRQPSN